MDFEGNFDFLKTHKKLICIMVIYISFYGF
jgi:hypothetical protein